MTNTNPKMNAMQKMLKMPTPNTNSQYGDSPYGPAKTGFGLNPNTTGTNYEATPYGQEVMDKVQNGIGDAVSKLIEMIEGIGQGGGQPSGPTEQPSAPQSNTEQPSAPQSNSGSGDDRIKVGFWERFFHPFSEYDQEVARAKMRAGNR